MRGGGSQVVLCVEACTGVGPGGWVRGGSWWMRGGGSQVVLCVEACTGVRPGVGEGREQGKRVCVCVQAAFWL